MPKGFENDTKMDAEISDFAYFFNKGENARKYCIYNIKLGSGHLQNDDKSIKKRCEIDAGKSNAKRMSNDPEMKPNGEPKSIPNRKSDEKKACEKRCRNLMPDVAPKVPSGTGRLPGTWGGGGNGTTDSRSEGAQGGPTRGNLTT